MYYWNSLCGALVVGESVHCSLQLSPIQLWPREIHLHRGLKVKGLVCTQELVEPGMATTTQHWKSALSKKKISKLLYISISTYRSQTMLTWFSLLIGIKCYLSVGSFWYLRGTVQVWFALLFLSSQWKCFGQGFPVSVSCSGALFWL